MTTLKFNLIHVTDLATQIFSVLREVRKWYVLHHTWGGLWEISSVVLFNLFSYPSCFHFKFSPYSVADDCVNLSSSRVDSKSSDVIVNKM